MALSVTHKRYIRASLMVPLLSLLTAAVAPAGAIVNHRAGNVLRFQKNGLPDLRGVTLNMEHTGSSPHVGDVTSYIADQLLLKFGATGSYTIGSSSIILNITSGRAVAIGGNWASSFAAGLKCFGPAQPGQSYSFIVSPNITKTSQLSGKIVADTQIGSGNDILLNDLLKKYHVSRGTLSILITGTDGASLDAFIAGRANAFWGQAGDAQILAQQHIPFHVLTQAEAIAPFEADSYECASPAWLQQNPGLAEAIDLSWLYAARIMVKDPTEWDTYAQQFTQGVVPLSAIKQDWAEYVNQHDFPDGPRAFDKKYVVLNYQKDVENGSIANRSANAPLGSYVEFGPWNAALKYFEAHKDLIK